MSNLTLIDAHDVFLIDICLNNIDLYSQDLFISNSQYSVRESIYQSALEFILHTPNSQMQVSNSRDSYDNECIQLVLENWDKKSKLICYNYDLRNYPASYKEDFEKYLNSKEITPKKVALEHFKEFLGETELEEDLSKIATIMLEFESKKYLYLLKEIQNLTTLTINLVDFAMRNQGSLTFKINLYPYFEIQYPDRTTLGVWLNPSSEAVEEELPLDFSL
jgi:hypothetical protein